MGATAKHPVFKKLINAAPKSIEENKDCGPNIKTGPVFMTKTLTFDEIHVFSPWYFFPTPPGIMSPPGQAHQYPHAYANHHWAGSWIGKEDKINWSEWIKEKSDWNDWHDSHT